CSPIRPRHRRIVRGVTPMISAADSQLIRLASAFSNTSCNFIIRSTSADGISWLDFIQPASPAAFIKRTDHVLIRPDRSCANDTGQRCPLVDRPSLLYHRCTYVNPVTLFGRCVSLRTAFATCWLD